MQDQAPTTLSTEHITDRVRRASTNWIITMQKEYGQEMGLKCFDVMRQTFGEDLCGSVLFGILEGRSYADTLIIGTAANQTITRKIEAIKYVRAITGLGLKEAKDAVEAAENRDVTIEISWEYRKIENQTTLERYIKDLEYCGVSVK